MAIDSIHFPKDVDFDEFAKDYEDKSISAREMQDKYRISPRQYRLVLRHLRSRAYSQHSKAKSVERHIYRSTYGKFTVRKRTDGKFRYFGTYNTLKEAREIRDKLEMNDWNRGVIK